MSAHLPQLLSLAPRGVIVDETGAYQGLSPWFPSHLLHEILKRYNEYQPLLAFAEAWARMPEGSSASAADARQEAALAIEKARKLSALVEAPEMDPRPPRTSYARRRTSDRREVERREGREVTEPSRVIRIRPVVQVK